MRVLRYELKLAEFPYLITSSEMAMSDNAVDGRNSLPIKITIPEEYEYVFNAIEPQLLYDEDCKEWDFLEHYRTILLGKHSDWYLYACEVSARSLVLSYYNREVHRSGSIIFENIRQSIGFQLAVPHKNGEPDSIYDVFLRNACSSTGYEARVTEHNKDSRRVLSFRDEYCRSCTADQYVYINEYVDL